MDSVEAYRIPRVSAESAPLKIFGLILAVVLDLAPPLIVFLKIGHCRPV